MERATIDLVENADAAYVIDWYRNENGYTNVGKLIHDIKYKSATSFNVCKLVDVMSDFIKQNINEKIDLIVPVPSYNPQKELNGSGNYKLMYQVATFLGKELDITVNLDLVEKLVNKQAKHDTLVASDIEAQKLPHSSSEDVILLIDDLYGKGTTASLTATAIKEKNPLIKIIFLSVTKNKFGGMGEEVKARIDYTQGIKQSANNTEYIRLFFTKNSLELYANIFSNQDDYLKVKALYEEEFNGDISINVKENSKNKGFWNVSKVNNYVKDDSN